MVPAAHRRHLHFQMIVTTVTSSTIKVHTMFFQSLGLYHQHLFLLRRYPTSCFHFHIHLRSHKNWHHPHHSPRPPHQLRLLHYHFMPPRNLQRATTPPFAPQLAYTLNLSSYRRVTSLPCCETLAEMARSYHTPASSAGFLVRHGKCLSGSLSCSAS
jgi:hypothetical protein